MTFVELELNDTSLSFEPYFTDGDDFNQIGSEGETHVRVANFLLVLDSLFIELFYPQFT